MSLCGAFCNTGGKEGDFNSQERAQLAYRKNLLYVHSLRELTVSAVLPGIRSLLADLRAQQIPVGLASVSLNCADDFSGAGAARVFHLLRGCFPT
ncbi:beta-phosphoglucomutase [Escherichia coli]|uniref:Beta-phosphoglucomutase n=1 Tax=Escherichia coli TaxID=562 RepID=A0A2X3JWC3_ECOLX|nr:beta-phosphoglucomutase [Escherichia coli]